MSDSSSPTLFLYPERTRFGANIPKTKLYQETGANTALKRLFIDQVDAVKWSWKLNARNMNLRKSPRLEEIHVLSIYLKQADLDIKVLETIDRVIPHRTIFELHRTVDNHDQVRAIATYKRPFKNDARRMVLSQYHMSPWCDVKTPRSPIPTVVDMERLYEVLLMHLIPLSPRIDESFSSLIERAEEITQKKREISRAESRLHREKQFNRKVELHQIVRALKDELQKLMNSNVHLNR